MSAFSGAYYDGLRGGMWGAPLHGAFFPFLEDTLEQGLVVGVIAFHVAVGDVGDAGHA